MKALHYFVAAVWSVTAAILPKGKSAKQKVLAKPLGDCPERLLSCLHEGGRWMTIAQIKEKVRLHDDLVVRNLSEGEIVATLDLLVTRRLAAVDYPSGATDSRRALYALEYCFAEQAA